MRYNWRRAASIEFAYNTYWGPIIISPEETAVITTYIAIGQARQPLIINACTLINLSGCCHFVGSAFGYATVTIIVVCRMDQVLHYTHLEGINSGRCLNRALEKHPRSQEFGSRLCVLRANYYVPLHHEIDQLYYSMLQLRTLLHPNLRTY